MKRDGVLKRKLTSFYTFKRGSLVVSFYQVWCMGVCCGFPCVIAIRIPFPMDQILQGSIAPKISMIMNPLHFVLFLVIDQVRWWLGEVWAVCGRFAIGR